MTRALVVASWLAAACGPRPAPAGVIGEDSIVYVTSNVGDAQVYVDGRFVAPVAALGAGIAVEPGTHRFELRHEDYFSSYLELRVARAERARVAIDMAPVLP